MVVRGALPSLWQDFFIRLYLRTLYSSATRNYLHKHSGVGEYNTFGK
jgi:hypothetical protein